MIKNYFKIAWRSLFRNKGFSLTNVLGLTIGMTCTLLILLWVKDERTYDKFHGNYNNIYQVMAHRDFKNQIFTDQNMVLPLAGALQAGIPEIKDAVVTSHQGSHVLTYGDSKLKKEGYTVSEHFFDVFTWKFIKGNAATALPDAYSIVLTASAAKALFGNNDPMNKVIRVDNEYDAKVTAIVEDVPGNSSLQFDFINAFNFSGD
jgi:putative ABC transport system permease protein